MARTEGSRHNGAGSVRLKGNTWYGRWHIGGVPVERSLGPARKPGSREGMTRGQAETKLRERMTETQSAPVTEKISVKDAGAAFVVRLQNRGRSKGHWEAVESHLRIHITTHKTFQTKPLDAITRRDVDAFISALLRKGLAPKTVRNIASSLHSVFELGRREGWCGANPVEFADLPAVPAKNELRFLTITELGAVLRDGLVIDMDYVTDPNVKPGERAQRADDAAMRRLERPLYLMAATTGLRMGELLELRWRDVDWLASRVRVVWNISRGVKKNPKGDTGRSIPLTADLLRELQAHSERSPYNGDDDLVFAHPNTGNNLDRSRVLKRWKRACKRAGVRQTRFHDLRHTWGTLLASKGANQRALQEWGGWDDPNTAKRYLNYAPAADEAEFFGSVFGGIVADPHKTPIDGDKQGQTRAHENGALEPKDH